MIRRTRTKSHGKKTKAKAKTKTRAKVRAKAKSPAKTARKPRNPKRRAGRRAGGAESSPKWRSFRRWIVGAGVVVALVGLGLVGRVGWEWLAAHPATAVREVEIVGASRIPEFDLLVRAEVEAGDRWLDLDRRAIELRLRSHPWVAGARVRRPGPGRVRLVIEESRAVARLSVAGSVYGVGEDLRVLPGPMNEALPLLSLATNSKSRGETLDPVLLARGVAYATDLASGRTTTEPVEVELGDAGDRLHWTARGFELHVEGEVRPETAVRNARAFLEKLDAGGSSRGTLRMISEETAVWRAA